MKPTDLDALIDACLEGSLTEADAQRLSAELLRSPEARARYWEAASVHGLLESAMQSEWLAAATRAGVAPAGRRASAWMTFARWPLAAGIVLGIICAGAAWAGVALLTRAPEPVSLPMVNSDFESPGLLKVGGYPKTPGTWRGDAAVVVGATNGIQPHAGAGMLQFLHADGKKDAANSGFTASDQWQLVDLTGQRGAVGKDSALLAEAEAWFNSSAATEAERETFHLELFAIRDVNRETLNALGSLWLRQSNAVIAVGSRRIVVDANPATWERAALGLPLPAETRYLLVHICATARPGPGAMDKPFPGQFADSVSLRLHPQPPDPSALAAR
jgi:hypothetical protein